jgi:hypothetical protein
MTVVPNSPFWVWSRSQVRGELEELEFHLAFLGVREDAVEQVFRTLY